MRRTILLMLPALLALGACSRTAPPDKRWDNYQKESAEQQSVGASAFEKRQAQLAEKRKKESLKAATPSPKGTAPQSPAPR